MNNPDPHQMRLDALAEAATTESTSRAIREDAPFVGEDHDASSRPSAPVRRSGAVQAGRLEPSEIQGVVRAHRGEMRLCYEKDLRMNPPPFARVSVSFTIERDGSVIHSEGSGDGVSAEVAACVAHAFTSFAFPSPTGGTVRVTYPIEFDAGA